MRKLYFLVFMLCFGFAEAQIINFPDANLKAKLLASSPSNYIAMNLSGAYFKIDADSDNEISLSEAANVKSLFLDNSTAPDAQKIANLTGLVNFVNLLGLNCENNLLTELDATLFPNLLTIQCTQNELTSLNVTGMNNLVTIECGYNHLTSIDLTGKINLENFLCQENNISSLDLSDLENLDHLVISSNPINAIDLSQNHKLADFSCGLQGISVIDASMTMLDFFSAWNLPNLTYVNIKNGVHSTNIDLVDCPNLQFVCVDESEWAMSESNVEGESNAPNCSVSPFCTFTPGGSYFLLSGNNKVDFDGNGCDSSDAIMPNLKYSVSGGILAGYFISDASGHYQLPLSAETHTITPVLENPDYFTVSPPNLTIGFSETPVVQDFCIAPNGSHADLEITILPATPAIPGFNSVYEVVFNNKGTITQSGTIALQFDDALLDFVSADVPATVTTGHLSWAFTDLMPLEKRKIKVIFDVNSPMDTPPVNAGTILGFDALVNSAATDEYPIDNTATLAQTALNSFDPNDKTCLEGTTIPPSLIGQYIHYIIRFENTGNFPATNIVITDDIPYSRLDITSLVPLAGSHPFETKTISGNRVEFVFNNINLPFDDANNDGYVAFKIKTKPNLVVGNTINNKASIYFDYNLPIVTNTATTTIQLLGNRDFGFSETFTVFPNPVKSTLHFYSDSFDAMQKVEVYNLLGQLVAAYKNVENSSGIDVSELQPGHYFVKVQSDGGSSITKFIKQ